MTFTEAQKCLRNPPFYISSAVLACAATSVQLCHVSR